MTRCAARMPPGCRNLEANVFDYGLMR